MKRIVPKYTIIQCNGLCNFYRDYGEFLHCSLSDREFTHGDKAPTGFPKFCELEEVEV